MTAGLTGTGQEPSASAVLHIAGGGRSGEQPPGSPEVVATRSYLMCATPRTGSYLLCDLLRQTGLTGNPTEYFSFGYQQHWMPRWGTANYPDYLRRVRRAGTGQNGVFGAKAHPRQLRHFARQELGIAEPSFAQLHEAFVRWFPDPRFIWMRRRDELRQAVSWAKSMQTNVWWDATQAPAPYDAPMPGAMRFDVDFLTGALVRMRREDRMWSRFFAENGIVPHVVWYEDLAADRAAAFGEVVEFLGLPELRSGAPHAPAMRRQSDATSERWVRRYVALTNARFEATLSACAGIDAGHPDVLITDRTLTRPDVWDESRHSLLGQDPYPGPFPPDYRLGSRPIDDPPGAGLRFVEQRAGSAREIVLPPRWLRALPQISGLPPTTVRAAALAAHLGADRVGVVADNEKARHVDLRGSRVVLLTDGGGAHGMDVARFLSAPPRPEHERGRSGWLIAVCVGEEPAPWAHALHACIAMLTRHRCVIAPVANSGQLAAADLVFTSARDVANLPRAVEVQVPDATTLHLTVAGVTWSVPQPFGWWVGADGGPAEDFNADWDTAWAPALAAIAR